MSMITDIRSAVSRVFAAPAPMASSGTLMSEIAVERVLTTLMQADDPDLVLSLIQISRADLRRLETDDEVFGALETRRDACINTSWRLEPGQGQVVDFFYDEIRKWGSQIMSIAWTAVPYGYSVGEIVYQRDGGRIVPAKVEEKPIEWFRVDKAGTLRFVGADAGARNSEGDPVDTTLKFLFTRHRPTYKQPYGEAVLSRVYWPWYFRHNGWRFWGQFLERFGMPLLIGKVSDPRSFVALMKELGIDSVIAVNQTSEVTAVPVTGQGEFKDFEAVVCRRIQKAILGQTLTTDAASSGSYALGQVHELVRQDRRLADIRIVSDTMQRWINAMTALNFPAAEPPQFVMEDGRGLEADRATRDAALANAGIAKFSEDYLRRVYDFEEGDVAVPADKPIAPALSAGAKSFAAGHPFARRRFTAQQEQIDRLAENAIGDLASPIDPKLVRAAVLAATSPDDLADRLATLMTDADPAEYRETLEQALFAADVIGYVHATEQGDR
jgi:phage gp29-like protein